MDLRQLRMLCNWFDIWILIGQNKYVNTDGSYNDWADARYIFVEILFSLIALLLWRHDPLAHEIFVVYVKIEKFQNYINDVFSYISFWSKGCSSIHFERIMGPENAQRMLGPEGWIPNAEEALEVGIVQEVVPHDQVFNNKNISITPCL